MAQLSLEEFHQVHAVLSADVRLPQPKDVAEVPDHLDDDGLLKRVLKENAAPLKKDAALEEEQLSLERKLDASRIENNPRGQKLTAARKEIKLLVLKLDASERENVALRQKLDASERENEALRQKPSASQSENCQGYKSVGQTLSASQKDLNMRVLFTEFRRRGLGKTLDARLFKKARVVNPSNFREIFVDPFGHPTYTFSGTVNHLANERLNLQEEQDDNPSPERLAKIVIIDEKLACLKAVSKSFQMPGLKWDGNEIGEGFFYWCLHIADVNKACHRDVTKELLDGMSKLAARGEYTYGEVKLGPVVQAAIRHMRLRVDNTSASTGNRRPR